MLQHELEAAQRLHQADLMGHREVVSLSSKRLKEREDGDAVKPTETSSDQDRFHVAVVGTVFNLCIRAKLLITD